MLNSLKNRILIYFLVITILIVCLILPFHYFYNKKAEVIRLSAITLNSIHLAVTSDSKNVSEFLTLAATNPEFYITGEDISIKKHEVLEDSIKKVFALYIQNLPFERDKNLALYSIQKSYELFCNDFDSLVYYTYAKGFQDLGLLGELQSYFYQGENYKFFRENCDELKMHEHSYMNRQDSSIVTEFNKAAYRLLENLDRTKKISEDEKFKLSSIVQSYLGTFNELVRLNNKLGLYSDSGLKSKLFTTSDRLENFFTQASIEALKMEKAELSRLKYIYAIIFLLLILSIFLASYYLSGFLVNHLEKLSNYVSALAKNDFQYTDPTLNLRKSSKEVREIYKEFRNMVAQIKIRERQRDIALEDALEKEKKFREMADLLPQAIFETDQLGNITYSNKAWHDAFGYSRKEIEEGLNLIEVLQTNSENNLFGINKVENSDYIAIRKGGTKFPALVYSDVITKDDKVLGRRGIIIDATLRNKYIESLQKETVRAVTSDKLKSSFLANMSHEIRTPMNSIIGFSNLLSSELIPEDQKSEYIRHIQSSGQVLLNLIDDIIDIAKIEAGEIKIKPVHCEPVKLLRDLKQTFEGYKTKMGKDHIKVVTLLPEHELYFRTDPFRLRQIITNLVSNAIKFTDEGKVTIRCEVKNDQFLEFSVEDTGVGLSKEDLNVIFARFKRTHYSEDKNISGTGLGLTISKNLVELLGGQMWVSSVPGEGTKFWFQLPYTRIPEHGTTITLVNNEDLKSTLDLSRYTILIAEDDDYSYKYIKEVITKTKARIIHAVNGREVVEAVKFSNEIDLILMDIQMPFMDGYDAASEIKKIRPSLPIIAQTARAMEGDKERAILSGCDDYITKPVNPQSLLAKIQQFLSAEPSKETFSEEEGSAIKAAEKLNNNSLSK